MQKFELGFALRGSTAPEVKQILEAGSMRKAIRKIIDQYGGTDAVLVTQESEPQRTATSFMIAAEGRLSRR